MKLKCFLLFLALGSCTTPDNFQSKSLPIEKAHLNSQPSLQPDQTSDVALGVPLMGDYVPRPLLDYSDVPEQIRNKVEQRFIGRTGEAFFKRLRYIGGGFVDLDSLYIIEKEAKNYEWKPSSYYLCFELNDSANRIAYCSTVETDKKGNLVNSIEFPNIGRCPEKALIISKQAAIQIGKNRHLLDGSDREYSGISTSVNLKYDARHEIFTWEFEQIFDTGGHVCYDICYHHFSAHNGKYVDDYLRHAIH